ncbi:MAG: hypothetical protein OEZ29_03465 [Candidatus Bathyarchaeota archaeon]|nr:hypothetical protein [Candidatus Bathyarchaeota archaeon]
MLDIPSMSAVVATIGVLVGVALAYLEVRSLVGTRRTDLVISLYRDFGSRDFQEAWQTVISSEYKDYSDYVEKYGLDEAYQVVMLFEGMGTLLHMKLIDLALVQHLISGPTVSTWEKMRPMIEGHRQQLGQPQFCEWFEYLYNEMQKREQSLQQIQQ